MAYVNSPRLLNSAEICKGSKPSKFAKKNQGPNSAIPGRGPISPAHRTQKLNLEVSPHRAVSAVRLMRIEFGGAFADLLNEKGKGSGDNEMGYVERTLGFRDLDDRDLRLVTDIVGGAIRWRRYLDHLILSLCHDEHTFRSMEPLLLQILRIGFYEIVKLEMPPYAVVDEKGLQRLLLDLVLVTWSMVSLGSYFCLRRTIPFLYPNWKAMTVHKHVHLPLFILIQFGW